MSHHGILLHVIFSTQYRKQLLVVVWRPDLFGVIGKLVQAHRASLLQGGGIADHVHLLLKISPAFAIADTIRHLKANSAQWINATHSGSVEFHWQRGHAAFSVSQSLVDVVKNYIINQVEHHRKRSFKEEYLDFLNRHQIDFNPKYVFEEVRLPGVTLRSLGLPVLHPRLDQTAAPQLSDARDGVIQTAMVDLDFIVGPILI
jgi:putative transposase